MVPVQTSETYNYVAHYFFRYCDCFANGEFCNNCNCNNCANNLEHEDERSRAIKACLERNPLAFHPKIGVHGIYYFLLFVSIKVVFIAQLSKVGWII